MIFCMPHIIIYFWIMFAPHRVEFAFWECVCSIGVYFTEWEYVCNNSEGSCNSKSCCTRKGSWILSEGPMKVESLIFRWYLRDKFMFVENFVVFVQKERWQDHPTWPQCSCWWKRMEELQAAWKSSWWVKATKVVGCTSTFLTTLKIIQYLTFWPHGPNLVL